MKDPKQVAFKTGLPSMFCPIKSPEELDQCKAAGMTEYLRADIPAKQIKDLMKRLEDCENALVSQIKYCGNGTLHTDVIQYRHNYHGGRQI